MSRVPTRVFASQREQDWAKGSVVRQLGRRCMGLSPALSFISPLTTWGRRPPRRCHHIAYNGCVPARFDLDTLNPHNLMYAFTSFAIQRRNYTLTL